MEVDDSADADVERRDVTGGHIAVEDQASVGESLVLREKFDDRVAAGLLLAVAGDPHVYREGALGGEVHGSLEQEVQLPLVIRNPPGAEPLPAHGRLERRALPQAARGPRLCGAGA